MLIALIIIRVSFIRVYTFLQHSPAKDVKSLLLHLFNQNVVNQAGGAEEYGR